MIKSGMKKGEKFTDGGIEYVVESVLSDGNYISKRADHVVEEQEEVPEEDETEESTEEVPEEVATEAEPKIEEAPKVEVKAPVKNTRNGKRR